MKKLISSSVSSLFALVICLNLVLFNTSIPNSSYLNYNSVIETNNDQPGLGTKK